MKKTQQYKTEKLSIKLLILSSLFYSIFLGFILTSFNSYQNLDIIFGLQYVWALIIRCTIIFIVFLVVMLFNRKGYEYYIEDEKLIFVQENKKTYEFYLNFIYKIYTSKSIFHKVIKIVQKRPIKIKLAFILKEEVDFLGFIKSEVNKTNDISKKTEIEIIHYDNLFYPNLFFLFFILLNIVNLTYLKQTEKIWINIMIAMVCMIGLVVVVAKVLRLIIRAN